MFDFDTYLVEPESRPRFCDIVGNVQPYWAVDPSGNFGISKVNLLF